MLINFPDAKAFEKHIGVNYPEQSGVSLFVLKLFNRSEQNDEEHGAASSERVF
jgi:hypothetical protein